MVTPMGNSAKLSLRVDLSAPEAGRIGPGESGGGAELPAVGEQIVLHYRDLEKATQSAAGAHLKALQQLAGR